MAKKVELPPKYVLPKNWAWDELGKYSNLLSGYPFKSSKFSTEATDGSLPVVRIRDVMTGYSSTYTKELCPSEYVIHNDDILIGMDGDFNINKWKSREALLNQRVCLLKIDSSSPVLENYVYYYLPIALKYINDNTPSVTVKHLSVKTLKEIPIPIPPLPEQQRIVARIESLLARLDAAGEKLQQVLETQEARRAAILHEAFTGRLTGHGSEERRGKREENSQNPDGTEFVPEGWNKVKIRDICSRLSYGTSKKSEKTGKYIVIRMGNLQNGEIDWSNLAYTSDEQEYSKYKLSPGDVLFNRTNSSELVGKTSIYRGNYPAIYAGYLIKLEYDKSVMNGEYLNYYLNSPKAKEYYNKVKTDGVNQSNINSKKIGDFDIVFPSLQEQSIIVERLNSVFRNEKVSSMLAQHALAQIDLLKKSILARAFRGELGTQDPSDPDARGLLLEQ